MQEEKAGVSSGSLPHWERGPGFQNISIVSLVNFSYGVVKIGADMISYLYMKFYERYESEDFSCREEMTSICTR